MSVEILLFQEIQNSSCNFMALPQALHSPSSDLQNVGSSPLHNCTQGTFSAWRGHRALQWHSLSKPQSERAFEVAQPHTVFPKIITHHSPCACLEWHLLSPSSGIERWHWGQQDFMARSVSVERGENMTQLICAHNAGCCAGCQKIPQQSEGTDRSCELPRINQLHYFPSTALT